MIYKRQRASKKKLGQITSGGGEKVKDQLKLTSEKKGKEDDKKIKLRGRQKMILHYIDRRKEGTRVRWR